MAIQVSGTTVIDNSRVLQNVTGLKTVGGQSILGSGNISPAPPSTAGDVGTYAVGRPANGTTYAVGDTVSGIRAPRTTRSYWSNTYSTFYEPTYAGHTLSGTWRTMTPVHGGGIGLWIRIS